MIILEIIFLIVSIIAFCTPAWWIGLVSLAFVLFPLIVQIKNYLKARRIAEIKKNISAYNTILDTVVDTFRQYGCIITKEKAEQLLKEVDNTSNSEEDIMIKFISNIPDTLANKEDFCKFATEQHNKILNKFVSKKTSLYTTLMGMFQEFLNDITDDDIFYLYTSEKSACEPSFLPYFRFDYRLLAIRTLLIHIDEIKQDVGSQAYNLSSQIFNYAVQLGYEK